MRLFGNRLTVILEARSLPFVAAEVFEVQAYRNVQFVKMANNPNPKFYRDTLIQSFLYSNYVYFKGGYNNTNEVTA